MKFKALNVGVLLMCASLVGCGSSTDDRVSEYNTDGNSSISNSINGVLDGYSLEDNLNYGYGYDKIEGYNTRDYGTNNYEMNNYDGYNYGTDYDNLYDENGNYLGYNYNYDYTNTTGDNTNGYYTYGYDKDYYADNSRFGNFMQGAENIIGNENTNVMKDMLVQK